MNHTINECPICQGTSFEKYLDCKDFTVTGETFHLKKCTSCNFVFTNPIPDEASIGKYYQSENYISHSNTSKGIINKLYHLVRTITIKQKLKLVTTLNKRKGSLLDIGCGTGYFLKECKTAGWKIAGTEPDDQTRQAAITNTGIQIDSSIFSLSGKYDIITMWHVLEHIHRLNENIDHIKNLLNKDGKLVIALPNCNSYDAKHYKEYWAAFDVPRHLYHFNENSINILMEKHGYKLIKTVGMKFDSFYISMISEGYIQTERRKKTKITGLIKAFYVGLLSNIKASKNYSSNIYIFEKLT